MYPEDIKGRAIDIKKKILLVCIFHYGRSLLFGTRGNKMETAIKGRSRKFLPLKTGIEVILKLNTKTLAKDTAHFLAAYLLVTTHEYVVCEVIALSFRTERCFG